MFYRLLNTVPQKVSKKGIQEYHQKQSPEEFYKKAVFKDFAIFIEKN